MFGIYKIFSKFILSNTIRNYGKHVIKQPSKFDSTFIIVRVTPADFQRVIDLYRYSYFNGEPTMMAAGLSYKSNPVIESKLMECLTQGTSLMALCRRTGNLVGGAINVGQCPWDPDLLDDFADNCTCPKVAEVFRFYSHISRKPNLWERFNEFKIFEVCYLATDINSQGRGIGYNLIRKSIELGKDLTYNIIRVDATSKFTQRACQKLKMIKVADIPYKSYVDCNGKPVLLPPPPHDNVEVYIDMPHASPEQRHQMLK